MTRFPKPADWPTAGGHKVNPRAWRSDDYDVDGEVPPPPTWEGGSGLGPWFAIGACIVAMVLLVVLVVKS